MPPNRRTSGRGLAHYGRSPVPKRPATTIVDLRAIPQRPGLTRTPASADPTGSRRMMAGQVTRRRCSVAEGAGALPDAELLALLDDDPQGWVLARSVREDGQIVDFELLYINDAGARFAGRPRHELIGNRYRRLWPKTVHEATLPLYRSVVETRRPAIRTVYYDRATVAGHFELQVLPYG